MPEYHSLTPPGNQIVAVSGRDARADAAAEDAFAIPIPDVHVSASQLVLGDPCTGTGIAVGQ